MFDSLEGLKRSHSCGELHLADAGREVVLMGWVQRRRDHGGLIFVDLRDRDGLTQVVCDPKVNPDAHVKAGVLLVRMGVSTSMKPWLFKNCRVT